MTTPRASIPEIRQEGKGFNTFDIMVGLQKAHMHASHLPSDNSVLVSCMKMDRQMASAKNILLAPVRSTNFRNIQTCFDILNATMNSKNPQGAASVLNSTQNSPTPIKERISQVNATASELEAVKTELTRFYTEALTTFHEKIFNLLSTLQPTDSITAATTTSEEVKRSIGPLLQKIEAYHVKRKNLEAELRQLSTDVAEQMKKHGVHVDSALTKTQAPTKQTGESSPKPE